MNSFREFVERDFDDIKTMVFGILDPEGSLDQNEKSLLSRKLTEFKNKGNLLTSPGMSAIINKRKNREAIVSSIKNDTTTVGQLLSLLSQSQPTEKRDYLG